MNKIWEEFIECDCGAEGIAIGKIDDEIYLAFFNQGFYGIGSLTWKQRFRHIWAILTKGTCWADNIVLSNDKAVVLSKKLYDMTKDKPNERL